MTSNELISHFNRVYGIEKEWPKTYEVDADTYANCCQFIFNKLYDLYDRDEDITDHISGPNRGLMFKGVELILKS